MKIKCSKSDLLNGINIVYKAVSTKSTMSIIECILFSAKDNEIKLTANDMELGIETIIDGAIEEEGIVAIEARLLQDIIRKLPDNDVIIDTDDKFITTIKCENSKFNIIGKPGDDFPVLPEVERIAQLRISQFSLKEIIRKTIFSISDSDSNKIMSGELFEIKNDVLKVVSLDGHRISIRKLELKNHFDDIKVIVPGKTLNELSKIIAGDTSKDLDIYFTSKHILFEFDDTTVVSRLIEGEYFKIDQMLSSDYETKVEINKKNFMDCIDRATLLVKEGDKKPIIIDVKDENIELKINSTLGSMNEFININKTGKDIMIGFNPKFLIDALKVIDDEDIDIYMVNPKAPCIIRDKEDTYLYLILPVNFNVVS